MIVNKEDTILVTGGEGFLGHFVCKTLRGRGYKNVIPLTGTKGGVDLTDSFVTEHVFIRHNPKVVLHLAARVGGIGANKDLSLIHI